MYAREILYGMMLMGAILLAGCSQDDVDLETTPVGAMPISFAITPPLDFTISSNEDALPTGERESATRTVFGHPGAMDSEDLYYTGFGVFASQTASGVPDMMYNQEVKFTFVGDLANPLKGFWSYQPLKYWPANMDEDHHVSISAYAPYTNIQNITPDADDTGIIGMSANNEAPYITYRRCEKPEDNVDLLWYYGQPTAIPAATATHAAGTLTMQMHHALARLAINVKLTSDLPASTKVLIEKITLTGEMAKEGRLKLNDQDTGDGTKNYPVWSNQVYEDRTITICTESDPNFADSYGIIDPQVRYVEGLPYEWQPAGVGSIVDDLATADKDESLMNALSMSDRQTYVYLIPQPVEKKLNLTVEVHYHKMTASSDNKWKAYATAAIPVPEEVDSPLHGNTTYSLNIKLTLSGS